MRVLVTRPEEDAQSLIDRLTGMGVDALSVPLLKIANRDDIEIELAGVQAVLVTSANGVRAFAQQIDERDISGSGGGRRVGGSFEKSGILRR